MPTIGITNSDKPAFKVDELTWGDEQTAMIANSTLMNADKVGPDGLKNAVDALEKMLMRTVIDIPAAWVIEAALDQGVIEWSTPGEFAKWLKRKMFGKLNGAFFDALQADEKK